MQSVTGGLNNANAAAKCFLGEGYSFLNVCRKFGAGRLRRCRLEEGVIHYSYIAKFATAFLS